MTPKQTLIEKIDDLAEYSDDSFKSQILFCDENADEKELLKYAGAVWGKDTQRLKIMRRVFDKYGDITALGFWELMSLYEMLRLKPKPEALSLLYDDWYHQALSYGQVKERVDGVLKKKKREKKTTADEPKCVTEAREILKMISYWDAFSDAWGIESGSDELITVVKKSQRWVNKYKEVKP